MKVTPLEIRQKSFEKALRGFDKDEVNAFLLTLSQEWERMQDESKELRIKLEATEREVTKLREVEGSLYKTLKTAEDTGANVIDQANKAAELHLKEVQLKAEALLNESKAKAKNIIESSESTSKQMLYEMEERLKALVQNYKSVLNERDGLAADLKRMGQEVLEKVDRIKAATNDFDPDRHLNLAKRESNKTLYPNLEPKQEDTKPQPPPIPVAEERVEANSNHSKSFFDNI